MLPAIALLTVVLAAPEPASAAPPDPKTTWIRDNGIVVVDRSTATRLLPR
jgi:hypothetical protein